ncbi:MAG: LysE family translocator [Candidatus Pacebacteria bacterium]|nr:LysE family translocator [Candidatus Paceibacterota bacterium]
MTAWSLFQMAVAVFLFALLPGPGFMAIMATGARSGFWRTCYFLVGEMLGDVVYGGLAIFSLGVVATMLAPAMIWVRYLGAAYIIWLGISNFLIKIEDDNPAPNPSGKKTKDPDRPLALLVSGSIIGLTNPKIVLFYISFFPQFINLSEITLWSGLGIMAIIFISGMLGVMIVAKLGEKLGGMIKSPRFKKRLNWLSGIALIVIGLYLLFGN